MKRSIASFFKTLSLLTRIPVPKRCGRETDPLSLVPETFPFVGAIVGIVLAIVAYLVSGFPRPVSGVFLLIVWIGITGGFHWDGWADSWETAMSPVSGEEKKRIRKDPHLGVFGVIALTVGILAKGVFLGTFRISPLDLFSVAVWSRGGLPLILVALRRIAPGVPVSEGMGKGFLAKVNPVNSLFAAGIAGMIILLSTGLVVMGVLSAVLVLSIFPLVWVLKRQDALSGDFMGLGIEFLEIASLLAIGLTNGNILPILSQGSWTQWGVDSWTAGR